MPVFWKGRTTHHSSGGDGLAMHIQHPYAGHAGTGCPFLVSGIGKCIFSVIGYYMNSTHLQSVPFSPLFSFLSKNFNGLRELMESLSVLPA